MNVENEIKQPVLDSLTTEEIQNVVSFRTRVLEIAKRYVLPAHRSRSVALAYELTTRDIRVRSLPADTKLAVDDIFREYIYARQERDESGRVLTPIESAGRIVRRSASWNRVDDDPPYFRQALAFCHQAVRWATREIIAMNELNTQRNRG